jgi:hypothetical protein
MRVHFESITWLAIASNSERSGVAAGGLSLVVESLFIVN